MTLNLKKYIYLKRKKWLKSYKKSYIKIASWINHIDIAKKKEQNWKCCLQYVKPESIDEYKKLKTYFLIQEEKHK